MGRENYSNHTSRKRRPKREHLNPAKAAKDVTITLIMGHPLHPHGDIGTVKQFCKGACTPEHAEWGTNRRNWRSVCSHRALTSLQSWRRDGITPKGWDCWNVVMQDHALFRRNRPERHSVALCVRQHSAGIKLCFGMDGDLRVRIKGQTSKRDTVVGVCCRPPAQQKEADEPFHQQLEAASKSQALALVGDFNYPDT